jgi:integrase
MRLTARTITTLEMPAGKTDHIEFDDDLAGFGIRLRATSPPKWIVQYRRGPQQRRITIGGMDLPADKARKLAAELLAKVRLGADPVGERKAKDQAARLTAKHSLGEVADQFLEARRDKLRSNTHKAYTAYLRSHWADLRKRDIDSITLRDVASGLRRIINEHGEYSAARAKQALSAMYSWAMREGLAKSNPTIGTNDPVEGKEPRDRVLDDSEIRIIWQCAGDGDFGKIVRLLLLTGCRRDEIGGLRWSEIDFDAGRITIPGARTKNKQAHKLTLPEMAMEILRSVPKVHGRDYLFGVRGAAFSRWSWEKLALDKRIAEIGHKLAPWRLHDLRRTMRTELGRLGVPPHLAERAINHVKDRSAVERTYDRYDYSTEIANALALWADHVRVIVGGGAPRVVPLHKIG